MNHLQKCMHLVPGHVDLYSSIKVAGSGTAPELSEKLLLAFMSVRLYDCLKERGLCSVLR